MVRLVGFHLPSCAEDCGSEAIRALWLDLGPPSGLQGWNLWGRVLGEGTGELRAFPGPLDTSAALGRCCPALSPNLHQPGAALGATPQAG